MATLAPAAAARKVVRDDRMRAGRLPILPCDRPPRRGAVRPHDTHPTVARAIIGTQNTIAKSNRSTSSI